MRYANITLGNITSVGKKCQFLPSKLYIATDDPLSTTTFISGQLFVQILLFMHWTLKIDAVCQLDHRNTQMCVFLLLILHISFLFITFS